MILFQGGGDTSLLSFRCGMPGTNMYHVKDAYYVETVRISNNKPNLHSPKKILQFLIAENTKKTTILQNLKLNKVLVIVRV